MNEHQGESPRTWAAGISLGLSGCGILMLIVAFTQCLLIDGGLPQFFVLLIFLPLLLAIIFGLIAKPWSVSGRIARWACAISIGLFLLSLFLYPLLLLLYLYPVGFFVVLCRH